MNLTATYEQLNGTAAAGNVTFTLSAPLQDSAGNVMYPVIPLVVPLDLITGGFSITLPATNDPTTTPTGLTYIVVENITNGPKPPRSYSIELDHAVSPVDLADLAPSTAVAVNTYVLASAFNALLSAFDMQANIVSGNAVVANNVFPPGPEIPYATTLTTLKVRLGTAPVGSGLTVRVNLDGVSIGSVTVAANTTSATATISHAAAANQVLSFDVVAIGSSTAGADIEVRVTGS